MRHVKAVLCILTLAGCLAAVQAQDANRPAAAIPVAASVDLASQGAQDGMALVDSCVRNHEELGLTFDQLRRMRAIQLDAAKKMIPVASEIQSDQLDLMQLLLADKADMTRIEPLVHRIGNATGELYLVGIRALVAARDVLTPEQRTKTESMMLRGQAQKDAPPGCKCGCGCCGSGQASKPR